MNINLEQLTLEEIKSLSTDINNYLYENKKRLTLDQYEKNKKYVGKCYYFNDTKEYVKVVSIKGGGAIYVSCLKFSLYPKAEFINKFTFFDSWDGYCGHWEFEGIYVEDVLIKRLDDATEISIEEYNQAMKIYVDKLLNLRVEWE